MDVRGKLVELVKNALAAYGGKTNLDTDRRHENRWVRWGDAITHWMPLPQPPKGE